MNSIIKKIAEYLWSYAAYDSWRAIYSLLEKGPVLLDLGCGDGASTMLVAKYIEANSIVGIDLDDKNLQEANKRGIIVHKGDLNERFPLDNECVDVVFANQVIEHMINVDNFVSEIYRVLRKGGYVIICTENLASWHNIFALLLGNQPYSGPYPSIRYNIGHHPLHPQVDTKFPQTSAVKHNTVMAYKSLKKIFQVYGFKVERIMGSGYYPFPKPLARPLCRLDPAHTHFLTLKARKHSDVN